MEYFGARIKNDFLIIIPNVTRKGLIPFIKGWMNYYFNALNQSHQCDIGGYYDKK